MQHVVQAGEYLALIASRYGVTVAEIWQHPHNEEHRRKRGSPDRLFPGDVLFIPNQPPAREPQVPPDPLPIPELPELPDIRPLLPPRQRALGRGKAKSGSPQKHRLSPAFSRTDILVLGDPAKTLIEAGWLLAGADTSMLDFEDAEPSIQKRYADHYTAMAADFSQTNRQPIASTSDPYPAPSRRPNSEVSSFLSKAASEAPRKIYRLLLMRGRRTVVDPWRYKALLDLAAEGHLDLLRSSFHWVRRPPALRAKHEPEAILWDSTRSAKEHGVTLAPHSENVREEARIRKVYPNNLFTAKAKMAAGSPDPNRWLVVVKPPMRNKPVAASLSHEVYGHVHLARRRCVNSHILIKRGVEQKPTVVKGSPPVPENPNGDTPSNKGRSPALPAIPNAHGPSRPALPILPTGGLFEGIASAYIVDHGQSAQKSEQRGFTELFAEYDERSFIPPTYGVGPAGDGPESWADHALKMLEFIALMSHKTAPDPKTGKLVNILKVKTSGNKPTGTIAVLPSIPNMATLNIYVPDFISMLNNTHACLLRAALQNRVVMKRPDDAHGEEAKQLAKSVRDIALKTEPTLRKGIHSSIIDIRSGNDFLRGMLGTTTDSNNKTVPFRPRFLSVPHEAGEAFPILEAYRP